MTIKKAFLFPGQGSQLSGMGASLYETFPDIRYLFDQADEILGYGLRNIMFYGAEAVDFETGLQLVDARAKAMQKACEMTDSTMAAILGLDDNVVIDICSNTPGVVVAANFNCPG